LKDIPRDFPIFEGLSPAQIGALTICMTRFETDSPHTVSCRGARGTEVFFILSGNCVGLVQTRSGKDVVVDRLRPGRIFGELGALDRGSRVRSVRTDGPARLARVATPDFDRWLNQHPQAMRNLLAEMASMTRDLTDRLFEMAVLDVETRVRLLLIRLLIEQGALRTGGVLDPAPSHSRIAAEVGANREAVSRVISRFNRNGFLDTGRQRIVVKDAAALEAGLNAPGA